VKSKNDEVPNYVIFSSLLFSSSVLVPDILLSTLFSSILGLHSSLRVKGKTFIRGPFAKFVDSSYYSESELCGGAMTVSFSKYLPDERISVVLAFLICRLARLKLISEKSPYSLVKIRQCLRV
jgi:hypothetical protein